MTAGSPRSPCIDVCALDAEDICSGCFRSADEIRDWVLLDDAGKRAVLRAAAQRRIDQNATFCANSAKTVK